MPLPTVTDPKKQQEVSLENPKTLEGWHDGWFAPSKPQTSNLESTQLSNLAESNTTVSQAITLVDFVNEKVVNTFSDNGVDAQPTPDYSAYPFKTEDPQSNFKPFWTEATVTNVAAETSTTLIKNVGEKAMSIGQETFSDALDLGKIIASYGNETPKPQPDPEDLVKQADFQHIQSAGAQLERALQRAGVIAEVELNNDILRWSKDETDITQLEEETGHKINSKVSAKAEVERRQAMMHPDEHPDLVDPNENTGSSLNAVAPTELEFRPDAMDNQTAQVKNLAG